MKLSLLVQSLLLILPFGLSQSFTEPDVSRITGDPRFATTRNVATEIINRYPPDSHVVVGLGRTTGMTGMWAEELSGQSDYFRYSPVNQLSSVKDMTPAQQNLFWSRVLPSREELGGRRLAIHRVLWTAHSMHSVSESLYTYLRNNNYPLPVDFDFAGIDLEDVRPDPRNWFHARLNRLGGDDYHAFLTDIDRDETHFPGRRFIDVGRTTPLTPAQIVQGQSFTPDPNAGLFDPQIEAGGCEDALSYF